MTTITWKNGIGPRNRHAWLLLTKRDEVREFVGVDIDGWCVIQQSQFRLAGKWSHTTYTIVLADGVRAIPGRQGWEEGTFREGIRAYSWVECANFLGVSVPSAQKFLRGWKPKAAQWYDDVAARLAAIDDSADELASEITVNYGSPTRRQREAGFWNFPIIVNDKDGKEIARLTADQAAVEGTRVGDVIVIRRQQSSGHGGGYVSLTLAVPDGATARHGE